VAEVVKPEVAGEQAEVLPLSDNTDPEPVYVADITTESEVKEPELTNTPVVTEIPEAVYLEHYATSSGLTPAAPGVDTGVTTPVSGLDSMATKPNSVLQIIYLSLGILMSTLLLISIVLGFYNARPLQVVYGIGLLLFMSALFYVHAALTAQVVVASTGENNQSEVRSL
jgi:hypothetical protein